MKIGRPAQRASRRTRGCHLRPPALPIHTRTPPRVEPTRSLPLDERLEDHWAQQLERQVGSGDLRDLGPVVRARAQTDQDSRQRHEPARNVKASGSADALVVVRRRDLDDVGADDAQAAEAVQDPFQLARRPAADLGRARRRRERRVKDVDVKRDVP